MSMHKEKDQWIDDTMNSFNSLKRIEIPSALKNSLQQIPTNITGITTLSPIKAWAIAASIAVLIAINFLSIKNSLQKQTDKNGTIYTEYFSYLEDPS